MFPCEIRLDCCRNQRLSLLDFSAFCFFFRFTREMDENRIRIRDGNQKRAYGSSLIFLFLSHDSWILSLGLVQLRFSGMASELVAPQRFSTFFSEILRMKLLKSLLWASSLVGEKVVSWRICRCSEYSKQAEFFLRAISVHQILSGN